MEQMSNTTALTMLKEIYWALFKRLIQVLFIYMLSLWNLRIKYVSPTARSTS